MRPSPAKGSPPLQGMGCSVLLCMLRPVPSATQPDTLVSSPSFPA